MPINQLFSSPPDRIPSFKEDMIEDFELELIEEFENLLDEFFADLKKKGLKQSTINKHVMNAELFLVEYYGFHFLETIEKVTADNIYDFLGEWYFQKIEQPSHSEIRSILTSLKRLFSFLAAKGLISTELEDNLKSVCNDKEFFLLRFEEYKDNPPRFDDEEDDLDDEEFDDLVSEFADLFQEPFNEEETEELFPNEVEEPTLKDMIQMLQNTFDQARPKDNIIFLESKLSINTANQKENVQPPLTIKSLEEHCLALRKSNLVFIRWLDRYNCNPRDIPPDSFKVGVTIDNLLSFLSVQLEDEQMSREDIRMGHELLDLMNRMLWMTRHQISSELGLDLRLLTL